MNLIISIVLFVIGFILLIKGAGILIDGASSIAKRLKVSTWVVGLLIVGIGTSLPELIIVLLANLEGVSDISLGVIIGSNTFNIFLILGLAAIICPLTFKKEWVEHDLPMNFFAVFIVILFAYFAFFDKIGFFKITRLEGGVLFLLLLAWIYFLIKRRDSITEGAGKIKIRSWAVSFFMTVGGLIAVIIGGDWVVDGGIIIARGFGISEAIIGLTIISIGSSLPELFVSIIAAYKRNIGIAVGNIIGSNIFDFLGIIGFASLIKSMPFSSFLFTDIFVTLFSTALLFFFVFSKGKIGISERIFGKKYVFARGEGIIFVIIYIVYLSYLIFRAKLL